MDCSDDGCEQGLCEQGRPELHHRALSRRGNGERTSDRARVCGDHHLHRTGQLLLCGHRLQRRHRRSVGRVEPHAVRRSHRAALLRRPRGHKGRRETLHHHRCQQGRQHMAVRLLERNGECRPLLHSQRRPQDSCRRLGDHIAHTPEGGALLPSDLRREQRPLLRWRRGHLGLGGRRQDH